MFCTKCGTNNPDNANFCQGCGSPLKNNSQAAPENSYTYQSTQDSIPVMKVEPEPQSPLEALKKVATSGLFRFTAFAFCTLIISNILALIDSSFMWGAISETLRYIDPNLVNEASKYLGSISSFSAIISQLPMILIAVGLWTTYATAARKKSDYFNTAGLTLIKVIYVIELVITCVLLAVMMAVLLTASLSSTSSEDAMFVFITVLAIDAIFAIVIFWLAMIIRSLNAAKTAAAEESGKHKGKKASAFVGVVCYIVGAMDVVAAVANLITFSIVSFCNSAIAATVSICFGVLIFRFRGEMKRLK